MKEKQFKIGDIVTGVPNTNLIYTNNFTAKIISVTNNKTVCLKVLTGEYWYINSPSVRSGYGYITGSIPIYRLQLFNGNFLYEIY